MGVKKPSAEIAALFSRRMGWPSGRRAVDECAAGDQNPIVFNQTYELCAIRIADDAKRREGIRNAIRVT